MRNKNEIKKCFILIIICFFALMNSCTIYRKGGGTLNEKITKAHYRSYPEYRFIKKHNEKYAKKHGGGFCLDCILPEGFRIGRENSCFFDNIKQKDTLYIIEHHASSYYLTIWNTIDTASFHATVGEWILHKTSGRPSICEMQLVGKWNIKGIRYEEKKLKEKEFDDFVFDYATRIIIKRNRYKIDCIRYYQIWSHERDKRNVIPTEYRQKKLTKSKNYNTNNKKKKKKTE
jgi:hypothetical protein